MPVKRKIADVLEDIPRTKVLYDEPMSNYTSLRVGGKADALVVINSEEQLSKIVNRLKNENIDFFPAGNLTNIIIRDGGYRGVILLMTGLKKVVCQRFSDGRQVIFAEAGASLDSVISLALAEELTGMEFCAGIPGSVGGAVRMNAGAYGKEMKDVLEKIYLLDVDGTKKDLHRQNISFGYRKINLPLQTIILAAKFRVEKGETKSIKNRMKEIMQWRREKHPLEYPSAGSVFKNIPGQPAGKIIEELGIKGKSCGDAQISPKHANFIVNKGKAKAADVLKLIAFVQEKVKKEKNINLETEVVIIGED
ncbi:MAG TPA: UDP-N-acetylmuramate dehydrogenase [Smithellaceae bacterium]|jgi:UDP-N-acetylmuramate dehydrogenase|nr:MAG: UDP-N-acetylenolpyruvoylglucosamine reductase [Deltaproteobacteria bacterium ADurb.BinA014]HNQ17720.1 UDP-N-acetylmuramate dehydrogenase [Smithellaceae bacterium]HNT90286.1 UDP-N-acetylmuramate dehydrogenase [Smithellaceae bacterium]HNZ31691.1 UDP-N-acetylmuramate dehydrogenase [Smithellaceae bacterium]HOD31184.1 UDP-N-acetylmuramate dehydrogenase [Smithellaceae bacterium]